MTRYLAILYLQGGWLTILCAMLSCHAGYIIQCKDYIMQQIYQNLCHKDSHITFNIPPEGIPPTTPKKTLMKQGVQEKYEDIFTQIT